MRIGGGDLGTHAGRPRSKGSEVHNLLPPRWDIALGLAGTRVPRAASICASTTAGPSAWAKSLKSVPRQLASANRGSTVLPPTAFAALPRCWRRGYVPLCGRHRPRSADRHRGSSRAAPRRWLQVTGVEGNSHRQTSGLVDGRGRREPFRDDDHAVELAEWVEAPALASTQPIELRAVPADSLQGPELPIASKAGTTSRPAALTLMPCGPTPLCAK